MLGCTSTITAFSGRKVDVTRPLEMMIHCLGITKPHIVLLDAERTEVLGGSRAILTEKGVGDVRRSCGSKDAR